MTPKYRLSSRQRKELLIRNGVRRIAIPLPLEWPEKATDQQLRDFVIESLPNDLISPEHLRDVDEILIAVAPREDANGHYLGSIMRPVDSLSRAHVAVSVVVATISVKIVPRQRNAQIQWPGDTSLAFPFFKSVTPTADDDDSE